MVGAEALRQAAVAAEINLSGEKPWTELMPLVKAFI